jgi:signal transduction histidine kinase
MATAVRDLAGRTVAAAGRDVPEVWPTTADTPDASPILSIRDTLVVGYMVPVRDGDRTIGRLFQVRRIRTSPQTLKMFSELAGPEANVLLGNLDGSLWTNFFHPVERIPEALDLARYRRDGRDRLAVAEPIAGTPWAFAVEFPEEMVLAPSRALLWRFAAIAAVVITGGATLAWLLIRRVTVPLAELTTAAEAVSAGRGPVPRSLLHRDDEIGRLDQAFHTMAGSVQRSRENLEQLVAERTRALEEAQESLLQKERMAVLGQLASSVSHELRNPLGVMSNVVFYLETTLADAPPKVKERLALLGQQIHVAEKIVSDILDFTRTKPPEIAEVDARPFLDEQVGRVSFPAQIKLTRDYNGSLPRLRIDRVQIGQVIYNLLTNAIQAVGDEGAVVLRCRAADGRVRLEVEDDGPGVPPDLTERIFEPLFTTKSRGFGLGLSISRTLVQANGGRLEVANGSIGGARFVLELPAVERS